MFSRTLLAVDGSASGEVAVSFVSALARHTGCMVRVLHVHELVAGGRGAGRWSGGAGAVEVIEAAVQALGDAGVQAQGIVRTANAVEVAACIATAATEWGADVVVLGSRRVHRPAWWQRPGMRELVTRETALPVLIAPAPLGGGRRRLARDLRALTATSATRP